MTADIEQYKTALTAQTNWSDFLRVENDRLKEENERLKDDLQDARMMYCEAEAEVNMYNKVATTAAEIADNMGWQDVADLIRKENNR
jgi:hypothetical protein